MPRSAARATNSTSPSRGLGDHRARGVLDGLLDQRQRVLVVLVHDDDREVGVLGADQLDRLGDRHDVRRHLVAELRRAPRRGRAGASRSSSAIRTRRCARRPSSVASRARTAVDWRAARPSDPSAPRMRPCAPARPDRVSRMRVDGREEHRRARRTRPRERRRSISWPPEDRATRAQRGPAAARRATTAQGDPAAREQLVERFLPLARQLARRYQRGGEQLDDLVQVASLGLLEGDRPLRSRARDRVLLVRGADDPRRAQAPLPRQGLVGARAARPAGARRQGRPGGRRDVARARPRADAGGDRRAHRHARWSRCSRRARRPPPTAPSRSTARARTTTRRATPTPTPSAPRTPASAMAEDAATVERLMRVLVRPRARGAAAALRGGPHAVGDRPARRRLPDARLAADPAVDRAPARRGRQPEVLARPVYPRMEHWDLRTLDVQPHQPQILHSSRGESRTIAIHLPAGEACRTTRSTSARTSSSSTARSR